MLKSYGLRGPTEKYVDGRRGILLLRMFSTVIVGVLWIFGRPTAKYAWMLFRYL